MKCDTYSCKRPAVFKTTRPDKYGTKHWCSSCLADKASKYEMTVERVK